MGLRSHIPSTRLSLPFPHNSYPSDCNPYQHCTMSSTYCLTFSKKWFYWSKKKVRVWTKLKKLHRQYPPQSVSYFLMNLSYHVYHLDVSSKQPLQLMHYQRFEMQILSGMLFPFLHPDAVYFASAIIPLNRFVLFFPLTRFVLFFPLTKIVLFFHSIVNRVVLFLPLKPFFRGRIFNP